jgi:hypothetical protein
VDAQRIENKPAAVKQDANGLTLENQAKLVGQKRQQDFIGKLGFGRAPINIEMAGNSLNWARSPAHPTTTGSKSA